MMNCPNCGAALESGAGFCASCGNAVAQTPVPGNAPQMMQPGENAGGKKGQAIASLALGIASLFAWIIPLFGFPVAIGGLITGIAGRKTSAKAMATIGLVLSILGLIATIANAAIGAYMGATGQHPVVNTIMY